MNATPILLIIPALMLLGMILVPNRYSNSKRTVFRRLVTMLAAFQFAISAVVVVAKVVGLVPDLHWTLLDFSGNGSVALTLYFDNLALMMLTLVSFVGWVICQYSVRYLDGEATQGRYFRWTAFAIGSVSLMVVSGNLLMFMVAWVMTSSALHKLLLHYSHRPAAQRAAWTKFAISRIGDAALIVAIALLYAQFKTLDFVQLFDAAATQSQLGIEPTARVSLATFLLVIGAVTKSAQLPFHTWLPLTMETPTPVSALMHAGIVNAGGYLIIRMSPIVTLQPWAMTLLVIVGGCTACFAAAVMTTQTSVKKKLAYSTIAQMGFMLLQCGLGAFSAAMLHILAHSLYKAHAFLSSGSVMQQRAGTSGAAKSNVALSWPKLMFAGFAVATLVGVAFRVFGIELLAKPGGIVVGGVLCLALTQWVGQVLRSGRPRLLVRAAVGATVLCFIYVASFAAVDKLIAGDVPTHAAPALGGLLNGLLLLGFIILMWLQITVASARRPAWLDASYVHVSNGFYIENNLRRALGKITKPFSSVNQDLNSRSSATP
jgi:NAD(P)H-quinone oxidoreductase subunit 5